jgi:hypothetical protein
MSVVKEIEHSSTDTCGHVAGERANIIGGTGDAGRTCHAAQSKDRDALNIGGELQAVDQFGVYGRAADARNGNEKDRIDLARREPGARECAAGERRAEFLGSFCPGAIEVAECPHREVLVDRQGQMPPVYAGPGMQPFQGVWTIQFAGPVVS